MDKTEKIIVGMIVFCVCILIWMIILGIHESNQKDLACQELGFEKYEYISGIRHCEDKEGNLYYIKMDCKPFYWSYCMAKTISIGDVRILKN